MGNDHIKSPESEKLMYKYAKKSLRDKKDYTQKLGFNIASYAALSIASAKTAFILQDSTILQNPTQDDYAPVAFAVLSAGFLIPTFNKISEYNKGYYRKFPKELIKGLSVPIMILPLALDEIKIEPSNPYDLYGFNKTVKQDNIYYRGYKNLQDLAEDHGLTFP